MKYRRLTKDELQEVEKEFVRFLAANTITAPEWEKLKSEQPDKAECLIDLFSDQVFEQVLKRVEFLEHRTAHDLKLFHCRKEEIELMGLKIEGETAIDFTQRQSPEEMIQLLRLSGANLKLMNGVKQYRQERELELFQLMESGARINRSGALFQMLKQMRSSQ